MTFTFAGPRELCLGFTAGTARVSYPGELLADRYSPRQRGVGNKATLGIPQRCGETEYHRGLVAIQPLRKW